MVLLTCARYAKHASKNLGAPWCADDDAFMVGCGPNVSFDAPGQCWTCCACGHTCHGRHPSHSRSVQNSCLLYVERRSLLSLPGLSACQAGVCCMCCFVLVTALCMYFQSASAMHLSACGSASLMPRCCRCCAPMRSASAHACTWAGAGAGNARLIRYRPVAAQRQRLPPSTAALTAQRSSNQFGDAHTAWRSTTANATQYNGELQGNSTASQLDSCTAVGLSLQHSANLLTLARQKTTPCSRRRGQQEARCCQRTADHGHSAIKVTYSVCSAGVAGILAATQPQSS